MKVAKCPLRGDDQLLAQVLILMKSLRSQAILLILGVIRPVDVTGSAGERSPGAPFCASLTDRGLRLAVLAAVLPASPRIPEEASAQRTEMPATGLRGAADSERAS